MSKLAIRRVVVACDAACELGPSIETASRLAAYWRVSVHGVFLEDPNLRLAAGLPFVQQVTQLSGRSEPFDAAQVEEQVRGLARLAERVLAEAATRLGVDWSFSAEPQEPSLGGKETDLLVIQAEARPFGGPFRLASRGAKLSDQANSPVLLLRGERPVGRSVVLLLDPDSSGAQRSLAAATDMAALRRCRLFVLAKGSADQDEIRRAVAPLSEAVAARCQVKHVADLSAISPRQLRDLEAGLVVVDTVADSTRRAKKESPIPDAPVDVLLVR